MISFCHGNRNRVSVSSVEMKNDSPRRINARHNYPAQKWPTARTFEHIDNFSAKVQGSGPRRCPFWSNLCSCCPPPHFRGDIAARPSTFLYCYFLGCGLIFVTLLCPAAITYKALAPAIIGSNCFPSVVYFSFAMYPCRMASTSSFPVFLGCYILTLVTAS